MIKLSRIKEKAMKPIMVLGMVPVIFLIVSMLFFAVAIIAVITIAAIFTNKNRLKRNNLK